MGEKNTLVKLPKCEGCVQESFRASAPGYERPCNLQEPLVFKGAPTPVGEEAGSGRGVGLAVACLKHVVTMYSEKNPWKVPSAVVRVPYGHRDPV